MCSRRRFETSVARLAPAAWPPVRACQSMYSVDTSQGRGRPGWQGRSARCVCGQTVPTPSLRLRRRSFESRDLEWTLIRALAVHVASARVTIARVWVAREGGEENSLGCRQFGPGARFGKACTVRVSSLREIGPKMDRTDGREVLGRRTGQGGLRCCTWLLMVGSCVRWALRVAGFCESSGRWGFVHGTLDRPIADLSRAGGARQCFAMCATVATQASAHIGRAACRAGTHTHALAATCRAVDYVDYPGGILLYSSIYLRVYYLKRHVDFGLG